MLAKANLVQLKVKEGTRLFDFLDWFEKAKAEVSDTGRNRKGNYKKFIIQELEYMLESGEPSEELIDTITEFKENAFLASPQLVEAKKNLSEVDFKKFVELLEKAKAGA
jgi:hypothetical protein